ncbi:MAG: hypothetical protein RL071_934 [Pseudomonadota bacterium]
MRVGAPVGPVAPLSVARVVFALVGGGSLAALGITTLRGVPPASADLLTSLGASAVGGAAAAVVCVAELRGEALGLRPARARAWAAALALPLVFTVLGSAWLALLSALGAAPEEQRLLEQISAAPGGLALAAGAYAVIGAPVAEELLFRGAMYAYVAERRGGVAASAVTGALFGLLHIADPAAVPPLMVMGVMLGELRRRGASLWPCIAAHALNNVLAVLLAMA